MKQLLQYFREVAQELKKVSWPNRQETTNLTLLVIGITTLVALYISGLDTVFQRMMATILQR
ncbi:MAG: preprotein translocase subunit SecE [Candidatus Pacebacteria bacterium RIFOXYB1_FULL_39_46]|nr:MAG: preprotein translocase subunit SecE [Candidatus Pacebacteria bacterium RIFOXYA1_FULL_38_18]OGJ38422.1 MAG: preprotein translocase subunit SecE [Candidatus Pacebacteria bacterium RIFOXYB1_FULL_39_46]OGJ40283.1 MAG: preprotein translocase subunit SecE [Candidatus Pacebacteria bacterium RIFOXYC1_FULL_39_21]OGJ40855.1 MAG: preprotein translocase subunit SecE [Candidatus Pacebacteria bacterium RIFOXYD1_FULL_39_27]